MDDQEALKIISALANGAHPGTGELFARDSPYQSPDVIRALFVAQRALEQRVHPASRLQQSAVRASQPRAESANAGKPWSADEDQRLLQAFDADKPLTEIAQAHGRTPAGIRARLEKHGRLEPSPATRWPAKRPAQRESGSRGLNQ